MNTGSTERDINNLNKERDFIAACDKVMHEHSKAPLRTSEVCAIAAAGPAPRYYVSAFEAVKQYSIYKKTGSIHFKRKSSERMYKTLIAAFEKEYENCQKKDSVHRYITMCRVINSGAPCFFLEDDTAFKFYYRAMANIRKRNKK